MDTTIDGLLNQRVKLEQPKQGYRVAIDTVLLAAAVPARAGERMLELGCGAGGAMLCLAARMPGLSITGIEIQPELAELCRRNIARNAFDAKMEVIEGDVTKLFENGLYKPGRYSSPPLEGGAKGGGASARTTAGLSGEHPPPNLPLKGGGTCSVLAGTFDHVIMNPPYYDEARHDVSPHAGKRIADAGKDGDLALWLRSAEMALKAGGVLHLIFDARRKAELIALIPAAFSRVMILPIRARTGGELRRNLFRITKTDGSVGTGKIKNAVCNPLILHNADGSFTDEVESVLRHMKPVEFIEEMT